MQSHEMWSILAAGVGVGGANLQMDSDGERFGEIVGRSPAMQDLYRQIELVAKTDVTVLIEGDTGTGKDLVARTLHWLSPRSSQPFVVFNAPNLHEHLFESELFGHVRGAFSGAQDHHDGLARAADGGTMFIDEVGELPMSNQAKLLRFLDAKEVRPVGSTRTSKVDVRIVCATNRQLDQDIREHKFRPDLYYRLRVVTIRVPSLNERREDIPLLISHFLDVFSKRYGKQIESLTPEARKTLLGHTWEGNVRELENEIERAVVMTPHGEAVGLDVLSPQVREPSDALPSTPGVGLKEHRKEMETQLVFEALERSGWNVSAAARDLDISRVGLTKKMKRLGIRRPEV